ncbi:CATRA conflict system CASPASE/TPR repeat-associated protein [Streptomyces sp. NPDC058202]|uniref:CATRA conflict system CASPASE/TPR repeat-associated protein n=1 Tax=Streptomyces sp. NPDC058202 TaxID=3346380 RepID=UPI0036E7EE93
MRSAALIVHVFVDRGRVNTSGSASRLFLDRVWEACGRLGLSQPVAGLGVPDTLPMPIPRAVGFRLLATRERSGAGCDLAQAMAYCAGDVVGVTLFLAPEPSLTWAALENSWIRSCPGVFSADLPDGVLGTTRIYRALTDGPVVGDPATTALERRVRRSLPRARGGRTVLERARTTNGFLLWEGAGPTNADGVVDGRHRRLVVLAPATREDQLDAWLWSRGVPELVPMTRYLRHAAALHHQAAIYRADGSLRAVRQVVDEAVDALTRAQSVPPGTVSLEQLQAGASRLAGIQVASTGLITTLTRLRMMQRGAQVAEHNMKAALGLAVLGSQSDPGASEQLLSHDRRVIAWLIDALDDEMLFLQAARERAETVTQAIGGVVQGRLHKHQQQLVQLQTAVIGALVMALTAAQSLDYRPPVTSMLQAPLIGVLASLALCLPGAVLRWSRAVDSLPLRGFDMTALMALGAASGWMVAAATSVAAGNRHGLTGWSVLGAAAGGGLAWLVGRLAARNRAR